MATSIAVVIPTLNEERVLSRTLLALRQLRFDEVVLVDGGSRDQTVSIAQNQLQGLSLQPAKMMVAEQGRAPQMNAGAKATRSDALLFLHADTLLPPETRNRNRAGPGESPSTWGAGSTSGSKTTAGGRGSSVV